IAAARAKPEGVKYGSAGPGNPRHLAAALLAAATRVRFLHVPYKGETPAITDRISGQVDMMVSMGPALVPHVRSGKLRALAVAQPTRFATLPEVATMNEAGLPSVVVTGWTGIVAPTGTPPEIVHKLRAEVVKVLDMPDVRETPPK